MDNFLLNFFNSVSLFGGEIALVTLLTLISLYLLFSKKRTRFAGFTLFNYLVTIATVVAIKDIVQKPRSLLALVEEKSYAFPSGHTALAMTTFLLLFFISNSIENKFWKIFLKIFAIFWILATIFARLYLGVHDMPDIIASAFIAVFVFIISFTIPSFRKDILARDIKK